MGFFISNINPVYVFRRKGDVADPYVTINETIKVNTTGNVILKEIPDKFNRVVIQGMFEVQDHKNIKLNEFYVDYVIGIVYFNDAKISQNLIFAYMGTGVVSLGSSRVYVEDNGLHPTKTLQDLLDESAEILRKDSTAIDAKVLEATNKIAETEVARLEAIKQGNYAKTQGDAVASAVGDANTALTNANIAIASANTATTSANTARDGANTAATAANTAKTAADTATGKANTATTNANTATTQANTARDGANLAKTNADTATAGAVKAKADADIATGNTNAAILAATNAATNADAKAILADQKATLATTATTNANTATAQANTARDGANTAKTAADVATGKANTATAQANTARDEANIATTAATLVGQFGFLDDYSSTVNYKKNNAVSYQGSTYIAKIDSIGISPIINVSSATWGLAARRGVDGKGSVTTVNNIPPDVNGNVDLGDLGLGKVMSVNGKVGVVTLIHTDVGAAPTVHTHTTAQITGLDTALASKETPTGAQSKATLAETNAKTYADAKVAALVGSAPDTLNALDELATALGNDPNFATTIATQIGGKVDKVTGKQLSTEDFTVAEKTKLAGLSAGSNNYVHPDTHPPSIIVQDANNRFWTDAERTKLAGITAGANETTVGSQAKATQALTDSKAYTNTEVAKKANVSHVHVISEVTGLQEEIDKRVLKTGDTMTGELRMENKVTFKTKFSIEYNATDDSLDFVYN